MSDNRRKRVVAIALAVTLVASVFAGGAIVAAQTDGNETDGNETDGLNETQTDNETDAGLNESENETDAGLNETENETDAGLNETDNETDAGLNETENETDAGLNETDNETDAGLNETANETDDESDTESDVGIIETDNESENETDARADEPAAANETAEDGMDTQQTSYLRVVHGSPEVDAVDVSVDNETVAEEVAYGGVSDYLTLQSGEHNVTVTTTEGDEVVYQDDVTLDPRTVTTFAAASGEMTDEEDDEETEGVIDDGNETPELEAAMFNDNAYQPADGEAAVSVVHLSPDAGNVDVTIEGNDTVLADNLSYQNASDYTTLSEGDYTIEVRMDGDEEGSNILETFDVTVEGGTAYSAIALGYDQPPNSEPRKTLNLTTAEDATTTVNLPGDDGEANQTTATGLNETNETEMNETENETDAGMNETENETDAGMNETETEAGMNETENETDAGLNETANETADENVTVGDDGNETADENVTVGDDGNETAGNDTVGADENDTTGNDTVGVEENETTGDENETTGDENESGNETLLIAP